MDEVLSKLRLVFPLVASLASYTLLILFFFGCIYYWRRRDLIPPDKRGLFRAILALMLVAACFLLFFAHSDLNLLQPPRW